MKPFFEYLLSKSNVKDIKQSYYDFFKDITKDINDEIIDKVMTYLNDMPKEYKESLFEMLSNFYNEGYKILSDNIRPKITNNDKFIKFFFVSNTQASIMIFNMPKRIFSAVYVWVREGEIDWYLCKNVDSKKLNNAYNLGLFSYVTKNNESIKSWLFKETDRTNELQNIFDETK